MAIAFPSMLIQLMVVVTACLTLKSVELAYNNTLHLCSHTIANVKQCFLHALLESFTLELFAPDCYRWLQACHFPSSPGVCESMQSMCTHFLREVCETAQMHHILTGKMTTARGRLCNCVGLRHASYEWRAPCTLQSIGSVCHNKLP